MILFSSKPPEGTKTKCSTFQNIRFSRCTCIFIWSLIWPSSAAQRWSTHSTNHLLYYYSNINLDLWKKSTFISCDTTLDSVIDGDTCDDPRVCKNLQHPWIWQTLWINNHVSIHLQSEIFLKSHRRESGSCIKVSLVDVFKSKWSMKCLSIGY